MYEKNLKNKPCRLVKHRSLIIRIFILLWSTRRRGPTSYNTNYAYCNIHGSYARVNDDQSWKKTRKIQTPLTVAYRLKQFSLLSPFPRYPIIYVLHTRTNFPGQRFFTSRSVLYIYICIYMHSIYLYERIIHKTLGPGARTSSNLNNRCVYMMIVTTDCVGLERPEVGLKRWI